jgi:hypothetical protein
VSTLEPTTFEPTTVEPTAGPTEPPTTEPTAGPTEPPTGEPPTDEPIEEPDTPDPNVTPEPTPEGPTDKPLFLPVRTTKAGLSELPIVEGQLIFTTDTHELFVDNSGTERVAVTPAGFAGGGGGQVTVGSSIPTVAGNDGDVFLLLN